MESPAWGALPVKADTSEVTIVIPAEGPSLGMAPSGTWIWIWLFSKRAGSIPSSLALACTHCSAMVALSFITSPRFPVIVSDPFPSEMLVST